MVMILLNLSYIPDEVVKQLRFDVAGWSEKFQRNMQEYKENFDRLGAIEFLSKKEEAPQPDWKIQKMKEEEPVKWKY